MGGTEGGWNKNDERSHERSAHHGELFSGLVDNLAVSELSLQAAK